MSKEEPVEVCVILPFAEYRSIEQRAKKAESSETRPPSPEKSVPQSVEESGSDSEQRTEPPLPQEPIENLPSIQEKRKNKELKNTYCSVQIKKVLKQIERTNNSNNITTLENLDSLLKSALGSSKKILPNEKQFFDFLFENNLGHFVRNRNKINLYYKFKDNWWSV